MSAIVNIKDNSYFARSNDNIKEVPIPKSYEKLYVIIGVVVAVIIVTIVVLLNVLLIRKSRHRRK